MRYLQDYASELDINVQYSTEISEVNIEGGKFVLKDQNKQIYSCEIVIVRLGFSYTSFSSYLILSLMHVGN